MVQSQANQAPAWAQVTERAAITYVGGAPLSYQFDGLAGRFRLGEQDLGDRLILRPLDCRWQYGDRWSRASQSWLDLAFVNQSGCVGIISLKKESAINFHAYLERCEAEGYSYLARWISLVPVERPVQDPRNPWEPSAYYVASVEPGVWCQEWEYAASLEFLGQGEINWVLVGEVSQ